MASENDDLSSLIAGEDLWPLPIPNNGTPSTTIAQIESALSPSAERPHLKSVGSPQNHQAAARRRKKDGIYQCPFRHDARCSATFTAPHNLRYHWNAHLGLKPYKCTVCSYAAASPATLKRHTARRHLSECSYAAASHTNMKRYQATCKGITEESNDVVPKQEFLLSQELADIKLTGHFSFGGNEISHPSDGPLSSRIPANGVTSPTRLPPMATPSPQSSVEASTAGTPFINMEAVDDDNMAAELSRIQQVAGKQPKRDDQSSIKI